MLHSFWIRDFILLLNHGKSRSSHINVSYGIKLIGIFSIILIKASIFRYIFIEKCFLSIKFIRYLSDKFNICIFKHAKPLHTIVEDNKFATEVLHILPGDDILDLKTGAHMVQLLNYWQRCEYKINIRRKFI